MGICIAGTGTKDCSCAQLFFFSHWWCILFKITREVYLKSYIVFMLRSCRKQNFKSFDVNQICCRFPFASFVKKEKKWFWKYYTCVMNASYVELVDIEVEHSNLQCIITPVTQIVSVWTEQSDYGIHVLVCQIDVAYKLNSVTPTVYFSLYILSMCS